LTTNLAQYFGYIARGDEPHISETLRVTMRAIQVREWSIWSGNEDAFRVSLQILRRIFRQGRQGKTNASAFVANISAEAEGNRTTSAESNRPDGVE
jgi:hypothetical protein